MWFSSFRVLRSSRSSFIFNAYSHRNLISRTDLNVELKAKFLRYCCSDSITVTFKLLDGTVVKRSGKVGETVRSTVKENDPEFLGYGACIGNVICGGCHVILSKEDFEKLDEAGEAEEDTLCKVPCRTLTSRLTCGMKLGSEIEGIVLKIPTSKN